MYIAISLYISAKHSELSRYFTNKNVMQLPGKVATMHASNSNH